MEELEKIRTELLESHKKIAKRLNLGEDDYKSFVMDGISYFVTNCTLCARANWGDIELEVTEYSSGKQRIEIVGDVSESLKLVKPLKRWKKISKYVIDNNVPNV